MTTAADRGYNDYVQPPAHVESVGPFGVGEHNTCSNGPDDGTLNKDAARFWNCRRHGSTPQAAANLLQDQPGGNFNLIGHGNTGQFDTGQGQTGPYSNDTEVFLYNQYAWQTPLESLRQANFGLLSIWSCHTGEGEDGASLLFAMAQVLGRAVRASNGFLYVNDQNIWFEDKSVWVVATPNARPTPVAAPTPHAIVSVRARETVVLHREPKSDEEELSTKSISDIEVELLSPRRTPRRSGVRSIDAHRLAPLLLASRPFVPPGTPARSRVAPGRGYRAARRRRRGRRLGQFACVRLPVALAEAE